MGPHIASQSNNYINAKLLKINVRLKMRSFMVNNMKRIFVLVKSKLGKKQNLMPT